MKRAPGALVSRYSRALFNAAVDLKDLPQVRADLDGLSAALHDFPEFRLLLGNPRLSREKVRAILDGLLDRLSAGALTRRFVHLLVDKDRVEILGEIHDHFERLWRDHHGEVEVIVTTAVPVTEMLQAEIRDHLARRSGRKPLITWGTDPALLGGIVITWPDRVFDASLARKLENLKIQLAQGA